MIHVNDFVTHDLLFYNERTCDYNPTGCSEISLNYSFLPYYITLRYNVQLLGYLTTPF
jgi:hypothetical protein